MRSGTVIVLIFILAAAIIIGVSQFLQSQPPLEFTVVVSPLAEDWLRDEIERFNDSRPVVNSTQRIRFNLSIMDDVSLWQGNTGFTPENHPAAWIPASSVSVSYSDRYTAIVPSLARTPLVWGGYASRVTVATDDGAAAFDWQAVQRVAEAEAWASVGGPSNWQFLKLGFPRPDTAMSGLGVLLAAAGHYQESEDLNGATRDPGFRNWMQPIIESVPNFQTLGLDPAAAMARGPSAVEIALLPEKLWLKNLRGLTDDEDFVFSYPAYQFMLDFPLAAWSNPLNTLETQAVQVLADWLNQPEAAARAVATGLRPVDGEPDEDAALFTAAAPYGIVLEPSYGTLVQAPSRTETLSLIQWFGTIRR